MKLNKKSLWCKGENPRSGSMKGDRSCKPLPPECRKLLQAAKVARGRINARKLTESEEDGPPRREISRHNCILFVETVEKADQYFELKQYFTDMDGVEEDKKNDIIKELNIERIYDKLDMEDIKEALRVVNLEICYRDFQKNPGLYMRYDEEVAFEKVGPPTNSDWATLSAEELLEKYPCLRLTLKAEIAEYDPYACFHPVFRLVLEARKGFVMDSDPKLVVEKFKKEKPMFYFDFFNAEEHKLRENTVTFKFDGYNATAEDVKTSFPDSQEIVSVHITSFAEQSQMAHITFKDKEAATNAIGLAVDGQLKLDGRLVDVIPTSYNTLPDGVNLPEDAIVADAMAAVMKVEDEMLVDACVRYRKIIEKMKARKGDGGKSEKPETESVLPENLQKGDGSKSDKSELEPALSETESLLSSG